MGLPPGPARAGRGGPTAGAGPSPRRSPHLRRARGCLLRGGGVTPGLLRGLELGPGGSPSPQHHPAGRQSPPCRGEAAGRSAVKLSYEELRETCALAGKGGCWQACPLCSFPSSAPRGSACSGCCILSASAGFEADSCFRVSLTFFLCAGSL